MRIRRFAPLVLGLVAGLWATMLVATPFIVTHQHPWRAGAVLAATAYVTGGFVCHQRPERSFYLRGAQVPVCARCSGLYAAVPFGMLLTVGALRSDRPDDAGRHYRRRGRTIAVVRSVLMVAVVPTVATVGAELLGVAQPSNLIRLASALPLGTAVAWVAGLAVSGEIDQGR